MKKKSRFLIGVPTDCPHVFLFSPCLFFLSQVAMVTWIQSITLQMAECVTMR